MNGDHVRAPHGSVLPQVLALIDQLPLAHVGRWKSRRAHSRGHCKNRFDLRRSAVVANLHVSRRLGAART